MTVARKNSGFWEVLAKAIPSTESGDYIFALAKFVRTHRRFPSRDRLLFNDMLFYTKLAPEILNPIRVFSTDKEFFKKLVEIDAGAQYVVPTLAVLRSDEEIDAYPFPHSFCAKPTHMSGEVHIVRDGRPDRAAMRTWLRKSHYTISRERNYKHLEPKVIVEPLIFGETDISDYRVFCHRGKAKLICIDIGKYSKYTRVFYSVDWVKQDFTLGYEMSREGVTRPGCLSEMLEVAEALSRDLRFVRVDFYTDGKDFYVGELTHCHASATQRFAPLCAERQASEMIFSL